MSPSFAITLIIYFTSHDGQVAVLKEVAVALSAGMGWSSTAHTHAITLKSTLLSQKMV